MMFAPDNRSKGRRHGDEVATDCGRNNDSAQVGRIRGLVGGCGKAAAGEAREEADRQGEMTKSNSVTLKFEVGDFCLKLKALCTFLEGNLDIPRDIASEVVNFLEAPQEFFTIQSDRLPATCAGVVTVCLNPTDRFVRLVAALGAGDV